MSLVNSLCYLNQVILSLWHCGTFQHSLFLRITTLLTLFKSTLLLKIKCFDTTIYMKTLIGAWEAGWGRERVA